MIGVSKCLLHFWFIILFSAQLQSSSASVWTDGLAAPGKVLGIKKRAFTKNSGAVTTVAIRSSSKQCGLQIYTLLSHARASDLVNINTSHLRIVISNTESYWLNCSIYLHTEFPKTLPHKRAQFFCPLKAQAIPLRYINSFCGSGLSPTPTMVLFLLPKFKILISVSKESMINHVSSVELAKRQKILEMESNYHSVCVIQNIRSSLSGPNIYFWVKYHLSLGWLVIVYDYSGQHYDYIKNYVSDSKFRYHNYTLRNFLFPREKLLYHNIPVCISVDSSLFYSIC